MIKNKFFTFSVIVFSCLFLGGCSSNKTVKTNNYSENDKKVEPTKKPEIDISGEQLEYKENDFGFSFFYPKSLYFETQTPYPGGTIKSIGFRVDGITESTLLSNDLSKSLMNNDLYCNLDESFGGAVCTNKSVENYTNKIGTNGYKINREKTFYDDDGNPKTYNDEVYAFPINEKVQSVSSYKVIVLTVKMPSDQNLEVLRKIVESVEIK